MSHLLVTNDFPPKTGGIQTYLWELWRRLPPEECTVLTTPYAGSEEFDAIAPMRIVRTREKVLLPTPSLVRRVRSLAGEIGASLVVLDPALPLGLIGPRLGIPYAVVLHGAEVTVPARLPVASGLLVHVLRHATGLVAAGGYPAAEAKRAAERRFGLSHGAGTRMGAPVSTPGWPGGAHNFEHPPTVLVAPGVDTARFRPLSESERAAARRAFGIPETAELVVSVSRLVPRKGMDTLIAAAAPLAERRPGFLVAIAGAGRDRKRLESLAATSGAPVRFTGKVPDEQLPLFYGCADVFAMICRSRWAGLEQEGFGVVFLEAAACGVPQIAGMSGGSHEAVEEGVTGFVLESPGDPARLAGKIEELLAHPETRVAMGKASRHRVEQSFGYDRLSDTLFGALRRFEGKK